MTKNRMEAFSDGVLAIIITIMVLELKVPHGDALSDIIKLLPVFLSYVLSFVYIGIYWNNHHHMLHTIGKINGGILWANLHLLFWLSLLPFTTGWMGENHFTRGPVFLYGVNLLACAIAYFILQGMLIRQQGADSLLAKALGSDIKGKISPVFYVLGLATTWFYTPAFGLALFTIVALIWLVPDRRIERALADED
jgi:uncharacterized membrane protein